ncbi:MAG TPA: FtsH protease activity modulator HflK [Verrucomicrobiae bacterium]|nr:FtsH protease activity modulator HflK [Verrucomicrobiae bacterium]
MRQTNPNWKEPVDPSRNPPLKSFHWGAVLSIALLIGLVLLVGSGFYTVPADSVGIVQRFGNYTEATTSGAHFKLPMGIDTVSIVPTLRQLKLEFGFSSPNASNPHQGSPEPEKDKDMVTGDLNSVLVEWVVQYRIDDPKAYLFETSDPEDTLRAASEAAMREVIGDHTVDEVITFGRAEIESAATPLIQELCKRYKLGISVSLVQLKNVVPPVEVQAAFNDVNNAQQEKERMLNQATGEYNKVIPRAEGEAKKTISEAEGYSKKRINEAQGDAEYFTALLKEYTKAPEVTRQRLYLETMTEVLPRISQTIIIDDKASQLVPLLNLGHTGIGAGAK